MELKKKKFHTIPLHRNEELVNWNVTYWPILKWAIQNMTSHYIAIVMIVIEPKVPIKQEYQLQHERRFFFNVADVITINEHISPGNQPLAILVPIPLLKYAIIWTWRQLAFW